MTNKNNKMNLFYILLRLTLLFYTITLATSIGIPLKRDNGNKIVFKDERRYPNGSVIGKYTYKDSDGTPVHVKYYADDSSYGLELKSVKVFAVNPIQNTSNIYPNPIKPDIFTEIDTGGSLLDKDYFKNTSFNPQLDKDYFKNTSFNPYEILNNFSNKKSKGNHKTNDEYEIFLENDFKPLDNYNKEKVRVYVDKNKRKIRNSIFV